MGTNTTFNITIPMDRPDHQPPHFTKHEWRDYMKEKINLHVDDAPVFNESWKILKPPEALLEVKPQSYNPKLVTIGPLYHNLNPSPIDNWKALCVKKFMERHTRILALEDLIQDLISAQPHELSHIYNLNLHESEIEWLQLLVTVDTVFIHEYLLFRSNFKDPKSISSNYFANFMLKDVAVALRLGRDMLLMGNQIPMSFLKKISDNRDFSLADLEETVRSFITKFNPFFSSQDVKSKFFGFLDSKNIKLVDTCMHLLDSFYFSCTFEEESTRISVYSCFSFLSKSWAWKKIMKLENHEMVYQRLPSASQLYKSGIRFKACEGNISVMKYEKRKLQLHLPRLVVSDNTEDLLRNVLAYEHQTLKEGGNFTNYAFVMDMLIDTEEDAAILTKARVIDNRLGNDISVVQMWSNLRTNLLTYGTRSRRPNTAHALMAHYSSHWRRLYAEFYEKFFSRPWLWISVIAAFLLLSASILQTVYSIAGYYKNT